MIDIDNMDDFPKLTPDENIRFEAKDTVRRSPEMNFECSELEYKCIVVTDEYAAVRLQPDMNIVMPGKKSLKHKTFSPYMLWTAIAAAAAIALILTVTKDKSPDFQAIVATSGETKPETNIIAETKPGQVIIHDKKSENKTFIPAKKAGATTASIRKSTPKPVESGPIEQDAPVDTFGNKNDVSRRENVVIERITTAFAPVEMMNSEKTVFIYSPDYKQSVASKAINNVTFAVKKFSEDINDIKQNISHTLDGFRLPDILDRLSLDRGIDKEIDEWAKNNPGIPFDVFIDYNAENKMKEIYDENGNLVRVVFVANKSLKYKNNKIYQALN
ncbi:MAG: hypothetical protein LBE04_07805 [Prevotellaceae bacterium]|jgi:hypothetical protein|nr:hypothetical protein [Prevotellaceae bacterium]